MLYFSYIHNLTYHDLENSKLIHANSNVTILTESILYHTFFIINETDSVILATIEWFRNDCNKPELTKINTFDKQSMTWNKKLKFYEKFLDFNGCELVMVLLSARFSAMSYVWGHTKIIYPDETIDIHGLMPEIFKIAGRRFNFKDEYQPVEQPPWFIPHELNTTGLKTVTSEKYDRTPNVFFVIDEGWKFKDPDFRTSNSFMGVTYYVCFTPADIYTPYEKFLLPFDTETWILLALTFVITFITILMLNKLSKVAQDLIYGKNIETPIWNVISIFFGISQTQLPEEIFSRFILTLFIWFCLIFRTCFQSKFFEYMTSDPRKPPPETVDDLILRNYSIMVEDPNDDPGNLNIIYNTLVMEKEKWPPIRKEGNFFETIQNQYENSSAKISLINPNFPLYHQELLNRWMRFNEPYLVSNYVFGFRQSSFAYRFMLRTIENLIDTGIVSHLAAIKYPYPRKVFDEIEIDAGPKVFSIDDLAFGFYIWLVCSGICLIAFVIEIFWSLIICRKFKGHTSGNEENSATINSENSSLDFLSITTIDTNQTYLTEGSQSVDQEVQSTESEFENILDFFEEEVLL